MGNQNDDHILGSRATADRGITSISRLAEKRTPLKIEPSVPLSSDFIISPPTQKMRPSTEKQVLPTSKPPTRKLRQWSGKYACPVAGPFSIKPTWGAPRKRRNGIHLGVDIQAAEGTEVYAIVDGVIAVLNRSKYGGISLFLRGKDGVGYAYMHLQRYAPGIRRGLRVRAGQLIAYVGRTGIISSKPHLHFQAYTGHIFRKRYLWNPYSFLVRICAGVQNGNVPYLKYQVFNKP